MFLFEKLNVYQKSLEFAERLSILTDNLPKGQGYIIDQLQRAALSVPANIAEGNGRHHMKERLNFFWIARGSAFECVPILELCFRKGLIDKAQHAELKMELESITKMLSGLIESNK